MTALHGLMKRIRREVLLAFVLAIPILLFSALPAWALSSYSTNYTIGKDTQYYALDGMINGNLQQYHYLEYQPGDDVSPIMEFGSKLYGTSTISATTTLVEQYGKEVIAAINGDYFDSSTGVPIGLVIRDGVFISSNVGYWAVGFKEDGSAVMGKPVTTMTLSGYSGSVNINCFNKMRSSQMVGLLDTNFSKETRIKTAGLNVVLKRQSNVPVTANCSLVLEVVSVSPVAVSTPIAENEMVLTLADTGLISSLPSFQEGEQVLLTLSTSDSRWDDVVYAVGGKSLISNGSLQIDSSIPSGSRARSAVGIKDDGTVVFFEIDKGASTVSVGLTPAELANQMQELGCIQAMSLDGGGSSVMAVQFPGNDSAQVVNMPSDGKPRSLANYILLVNNETGGASTAKHLHIYPENKYVLAGSSIGLQTKATDAYYHATDVPEGLTYSVSGDSGTITGDLFTAGKTAGSTEITAKAGNLSGSQTIYIFDAITGMVTKRADTGAAVTTLTLTAGQSVDLNVNVSCQNMQLASQDSALSWSVTDSPGTISADGVFTAGKYAAQGTIVVSYGSYKKTIPVSVTSALGKAPAFCDLENHWAKDAIEYVAAKGVVKGETTSDGEAYFYPNRNLTRAEFAVIMARYLGIDTTQTVALPFADLADIPSWALGAVGAVYTNGIMQGSADGGQVYFYPRNQIVRCEVMTVIGRTLIQPEEVAATSFTDSDQIPPWAKSYVDQLVALNIVGGYADGSIQPKKNVTRAEAAKIIYGLY